MVCGATFPSFLVKQEIARVVKSQIVTAVPNIIAAKGFWVPPFIVQKNYQTQCARL